MNLVIDLGNTEYKFAFFKNDSIVKQQSFKKNEWSKIEKFIKKEKVIKATIISSVVSFPKKLNSLIPASSYKLLFSYKTALPIKNAYNTPNTLGADRLASAVGAFLLFPKKNVLVIDVGTCIKYNFINANREFIGGGISPGIEMRFKALNVFTDKLPFVVANYNYNNLIGSTTKESILSGVLNGTIAEVDGIINAYKKQYTSLKVVLTGGNYSFFEKRLKSSIFAEPLILFKGLNGILNYHVSKKNKG